MDIFFLGFNHFIPSLQTLIQNNTVEEEEFNLFLFTLLVLGILFTIICVFIGIIIALIALFVISVLITLGTLSISILVGIYKKSVGSGFKVFVLIFSSIIFSLIGLLSFWVFNKIVHWWTQSQAIIIGVGIGLLSGLCTGLVLTYVIRKLVLFLKLKLERNKSKIKV